MLKSNKSKIINTIVGIFGGLFLVYISYPISDNIKQILVNPAFQIVWLLVILWTYNNKQKAIATIMAIIFLTMRRFFHGTFLMEYFEDENEQRKQILATYANDSQFILSRNDKELYKHTPESYPEQVGLPPEVEPIQADLITENNVIDF